jgi:hypothetical protein
MTRINMTEESATTDAEEAHDRNKNHKDLATCHRIYRPLSPRPTSAARKIFGPNATQKKKHPMGRFQTGQRRNAALTVNNNNNNNNNIDPTQAIFLDAGSSVSSDSGWVTRYPATYRAITIKPGEMPIVQPQTCHPWMKSCRPTPPLILNHPLDRPLDHPLNHHFNHHLGHIVLAAQTLL